MAVRSSPEYPIANVQCQYDSPSDTEEETRPHGAVAGDHTYGVTSLQDEPPAFVIHQTSEIQPIVRQVSQGELAPKIMTLAPGYPTLNVIHVGDHVPTSLGVVPLHISQSSPQPSGELSINKRIRRSEVVLRQAAECVCRGHTFQTVSEQFNIPISTIRFFMARKGILPQRRRGRSTQIIRSNSPEPPYHMQHYKLPQMLALADTDDNTQS